MNVHHTPVTPLPWTVEDGGMFEAQVVGPVEGVAQTILHNGQRQNADYIAHAANAYPKLVEALRKCADAGSPAADDAFDLLHSLGEEQ